MTRTTIGATIAAMTCLTLAACGSQESQAPSGAPADTAASNATPPAANAAAPAPTAASTDTLDGTKLASFTGTAAAGEAVFVACKTCHVVDAGVNRIGPSLAGIVGRAAGTVAGFNYSPANKNSGITWTEDKLFQYLEKPQRIVPGTKMTYAGLTDPQKRADLIAWLKTK